MADKIESDEKKIKCLTMLYALLEKFGDEKSKKKFKSVFNMTEIGKMILEDGMEKGIEKGKAEGKVELLLKLLTKKLPDEYKKKDKRIAR